MLLLALVARWGIRTPREPVHHGATEGIRQVVEPIRGAGTFEGTGGERQFQVRTPAGRITVLGTEFSVELRPSDVLDEGDDAMKLTHVVLAVAVVSGLVEVEFGGRTFTLGAGASRVFAGEKAQKQKPTRIRGELAKIEDATLTITQRTKDGEKTVTVTTDDDTKVYIQPPRGEGGEKKRGKPEQGSLKDLKVGQQLHLACTADNVAIKILIRAPRPKP